MSDDRKPCSQEAMRQEAEATAAIDGDDSPIRTARRPQEARTWLCTCGNRNPMSSSFCEDCTFPIGINAAVDAQRTDNPEMCSRGAQETADKECTFCGCPTGWAFACRVCAEVGPSTRSLAAWVEDRFPVAVKEWVVNTQRSSVAVPSWFVSIMEVERSKLVRLCDPSRSLVPDENGRAYLEALQTVQSLLFQAKREVPGAPPDDRAEGGDRDADST